MKIYKINKSGMRVISEFLKDNLKNGEKLYKDFSCLIAWAEHVENNIKDDEIPQFEISSEHSITGLPEICYMDLEKHFDVEEIED